MKLLEVKDVHVQFMKDDENMKVLKGVSFYLEEDKTLALVGESGCGKTQTARCIVRLLARNASISQGSIMWKGQDILKMDEKELNEIRGKQIAMIFQNPQAVLNPVMSIQKHLKECITLEHRYSKQEIDLRIKELLESVKIADVERVMRAYPFQLSLGMCQRIMIAMAMASNASLWIVDEATSALDVNVQADILDLLKQLQKQRKLSMLLITHDLRILSMMSDQVAVMLDGEIVEIVQSEDIYKQDIPHHPYTKVLFEAMSYKNSESSFREDCIVSESGCSYASRCGQCHAICRLQKPKMKEIEQGHNIQCHF